MFKLYKCLTCGKIVMVMNETDIPTVCCGRSMKEIEINNTDIYFDKHLPDLKFIDDDKLVVTVGKELHPETSEHHIEWIIVETNTGFLLERIGENNRPIVLFNVDSNKVLRVYSYCNIHGLFKVDCPKECLM